MRIEPSLGRFAAAVARALRWSLDMKKNLLSLMCVLSACSAQDASDRTCPGSMGCGDADGELRAGAAMRSITPVVEEWDDLDGDGAWTEGEPFHDRNANEQWDPVWLAGFDPGRAATGVHDGTWARALSLSKGDTRIGIVALDLLGFSHDDVERLRASARDADLEFDYVLVVATHTHESQDPLGFGGASTLTSGYDPAYNARVVEQAVLALAEAQANEERASMIVARAQAPDLVADSREPIVIDQAIHALRFESETRTIATIAVWGNHAEALGGDNTLITSDFPHYLREELERDRPGSVAFFLPGTLGGLMTPLDAVGCPDAEGRESCPTGTFEKAEYIGAGAARAASDALARSGERDESPALAFRTHTFLVRATNPEILAAVQLGVVPRQLYWSDGRPYESSSPVLPIDDVLAGRLLIQTEVGAISIGRVAILTVPGEVYPELWLDDGQGHSLAERPLFADDPTAPMLRSLSSAMPEDAIRIVVNQGNDALGYFIPPSQWDMLPPHAYDPDGQYGEGSSLGPEAAVALDSAVRELYATPLP